MRLKGRGSFDVKSCSWNRHVTKLYVKTLSVPMTNVSTQRSVFTFLQKPDKRCSLHIEAVSPDPLRQRSLWRIHHRSMTAGTDEPASLRNLRTSSAISANVSRPRSLNAENAMFRMLVMVAAAETQALPYRTSISDVVNLAKLLTNKLIEFHRLRE